MAVPTQAFPPWLSPQPVTVTQDGTVVVQTTVVQFPQTYYGPSIPLGAGWVFGGSTFPASIATSFAASTPSTTAVPPSSQSQTTSPSTTAPTSATASTSQTLSTSASGPTSSAATSSNSGPASNNTRGLSSSTRLAVILSTILGSLLLVALLLVLCRIRRRQQRRRGLAPEGNLSWFMVNRSSPHQVTAEEGEGEVHGEDAAFLSDEHGMRERERGPVGLPAWPKPAPVQPQSYEPMALAAHNTASTSGSGSAGTKTDSSTVDSAAKREDLARFNASSSTADAGSLFFNPARASGSGLRRSDEAAEEEAALAAGVAAALSSSTKDYTTRPPGAAPPRVPPRSSSRPTSGSPTGVYFHPASPRSARDDDGMYDNDSPRFGALRARESLEDDAEAQFLPPRRIDPDRMFRPQNSQSGSPGSRGSWVYPDSPPSETDERATLLTARRVNVGSTTHPVLASPPTEKRESLEGWVSPISDEESDEKSNRALSPSSWAASVGMGGLTGFARGLGRLSWFRRMDNQPGPSGTRHSSPTRSRHGPGSRPGSMISFALPTSRPASGLLHPPLTSRPQSGVSFRGFESELGLRPPGIRVSGTGSASGGSGSGKSGGSVYHSASSHPRTPFYASVPDHLSQEAQEAYLTLPPDLDLGEAGDTIRSVDVLDLPAPERSLPFGPSALPDPSSSRGIRPDTASSRGTGVAFPPGLVAVPQWDNGSRSSSTKDRDVLEDEPPQAGGEWSSLRSRGSDGDNEGNGGSGMRRGGPVTRSSTGEQAVRVVMGERAASERASIASGPRHPSDADQVITIPTSPRSPTNLGFALTPRVSMYASSHSDLFSHSGSGSHSSRPSHHTLGSHSQEYSQPSSSNNDSEDGHPPLPPPGTHFNRASLSAMGGEQDPPQLPPLRPLSHMQVMEPTTEDRETEDGSETASRTGTGTSRPLSQQTHTGTLASGTSTSAQTTVPSTIGSTGKR